MEFKINNKVWVLPSKKIDGRYNKGKIVGIELFYYGLGFLTETQYLNDFESPRYKVAYVDVFTGRACAEWYLESDLQKDRPNV